MKHFLDIHQNPIHRDSEEVVWRISAYALIRSSEDKILLVLPVEGNGKWVLPGGKIEPHESMAEGVERECYEETGYQVKVDTTHPLHASESSFYDETKFYHSINLIYPARLLSDEQKVDAIAKDEIKGVE